MASTSAWISRRNSLRLSIGPAVQPPSSVYIGTALNIGNQSSFCPSYHASGRIWRYLEAIPRPLWRESGAGILALGDRNDLKIDQVRPFSSPMLQEDDVVAFYDFEATAQVCRHPTADEADLVRHQTPPFMEPGINSRGIVVS